MIRLANVTKSYGATKALDCVSLSLPDGVIGLVGNNGAGKSTLLKILLGLLHPDEGEGTILDCPLGRSSAIRGRVGYLAESAAVVPGLKGAEFIALSGQLCGMPTRDARRRAHEVLNYVGLGELRYRKLEEYSTGNQQRLKLAAALVHDPDLLLLDEPTNGLDPAGRAAMLRLLEDLIAETGKSVILCTHLLGDVQRLCEHVVVLHRGRVILSGPIEQLRESVRDRYTIAWLGEGDSLPELLRGAGAEVVATNGAGGSRRYSVQTPPDWTTRRLFELAQQAGVALTTLTPEEEDLEALFFRVTESASVRSDPI